MTSQYFCLCVLVGEFTRVQNGGEDFNFVDRSLINFVGLPHAAHALRMHPMRGNKVVVLLHVLNSFCVF